jgi:sugar transferase (PEP-CTERM/EpsH1 system associated)
MKILFLAHRTPYPPDKGDKIRSYNLLAQLAKRHEVTLVYWVDEVKDLAQTTFLQSLCRGRVFPIWMNSLAAICRALISLLRGRSFSQGYYGAKSFKRAVDSALREGPFDVVYVFSSAIASYAREIEGATKIIDFVDVDSDKWGQLAAVSRFPLSTLYRLEQKRLSSFEVDISSWAHLSLFVSSADAELFKKQAGKGRIEVLPNGTDMDLRDLPIEPHSLELTDLKIHAQHSGARLIFVGTMNYDPNIDAVVYFAREIFPLIRQKFPQAELEIVGRSPNRSVRRLASVDGIRVVGEVPDVRSHLLYADVSLAPMRVARGVQNKVLEAMAMGVPVVATPAAIQGLEVTHGVELLIGKTPQEFAAHVVQLLSDAELRRKITERARRKLNETYNWDIIGRRLEIFLTRALVGSSQRINGAVMCSSQRLSVESL